jgi:hypothetical protein
VFHQVNFANENLAEHIPFDRHFRKISKSDYSPRRTAMKRKYVAILPGVLAMVLLLALACSTEEPTVAPVAAQPTEQMAPRLPMNKAAWTSSKPGARWSVLAAPIWPASDIWMMPGSIKVLT